MSNEFNPGELVSLKSGGPIMTVQSVDEDKVIVTWFDDENNLQKDEFFYFEIEHNDDRVPSVIS